MAETDTEQPTADATQPAEPTQTEQPVEPTQTEQPTAEPVTDSLTMAHESGHQVSLSLPDLTTFNTTRKGVLRRVDPRYQAILERNGFTVRASGDNSTDDGSETETESG